MAKQKTIYDVGPLRTITSTLDLLSKEQGEQRMVLITGQQGIGKTSGALHWCELRRGEGVYLRMPPSSCLPVGQLLDHIEAALGLSRMSTVRLHRIHAIIDQLRDNPRVLVIDEADEIGHKDHLGVLRYIHDLAGARIAFISFPKLRQKFLGDPALKGRVFLAPALECLTRAEVRTILRDLGPDVADVIHDLSGGRTREVIVLSDHLRRLPEDARTADNLRSLARKYTLTAQVA